MIRLTAQEAEIAGQIAALKKAAGTHSPSLASLAEKVPGVKIAVDACFLSNPYAMELFLTYFDREIIKPGKLKTLLEAYPSQNPVLAEVLAPCLGVPAETLFIGNGSIEIIQTILHRFTRHKILVNIPTFSSYYEFARPRTKIIYNPTSKDEGFRLDVDAYVRLVRDEKPDTAIVINPNNPDGSYLSFAEIRGLLRELEEVETVVLDESFIHFATEGDDFALKSAVGLVAEHPNLVVVKSMSKDFGIAGIRTGYAVMREHRVRTLLSNGFLWNSSGLAEYFFRLYVRPDFQTEYERVRVRYIRETREFFDELRKIPALKVYDSQANFALVELLDGTDAKTFVSKMLIKYGIYMRNCSDKTGLTDRFVRIASRTREENRAVAQAIVETLK